MNKLLTLEDKVEPKACDAYYIYPFVRQGV